MARVMMALGEFRFSLDTAAYQTVTDTAAYRWVAQARLGRQPAMQYLGPGERKVDLRGTIYPTFRGGLGQIDRMREIAADGEALLMVDGFGNVSGKWVITEVSETQRLFLPGGVPQRIDFSLSLQAYGED